MKNPTSIRALFSLPSFVAASRLVDFFGDRYARVLVLRRRNKLRAARSVGTVAAPGISRPAGFVSTSSSSAGGSTAGASINADAITRGDGGTVTVWADGHTGYAGNISAKGGQSGGNGGFVEVSGKNTLDFTGRVDTSAPAGRTGTLLLEPSDITISRQRM